MFGKVLKTRKIHVKSIFWDTNIHYDIFSCFKGSTYLCFATAASWGAQNLPDKRQLTKIRTSLLVVLVAGGFFSATLHSHFDPSQLSLNTSGVPSEPPPQGSLTWESDLATIPQVKLLRGRISTKLHIQLSFLSVCCSLILDSGRFCSLNQGHSTSTIPDIPTLPSGENVLRAHGKASPAPAELKKCIFIPCKFHYAP